MIKKKFTHLSLIPTHIYLPLIVAFLWNQIVYCGSRMLMKNHFHYDLTTTMDSFIPVIPWTLAIYVFSFIYWPCQYILCCQMKKEHAYHFLSADFFAKTVCLIFFLFFPTTNIRPQISEHGIWNLSLNLLYRLDAPDNLFPSIHCLVSWLCYVGIRRQQQLPQAYRLFVLCMALAICISTLTTKQHVIPDVTAGILLAEFSYWFVHYSHLDHLYASFFTKIIRS